MWAKNWVTHAWDELGRDAVGNGDILQRYPGLNAHTYMSDTGKVKLRIQHEVVAPYGGSFEALADIVEVRVHGAD